MSDRQPFPLPFLSVCVNLRNLRIVHCNAVRVE